MTLAINNDGCRGEGGHDKVCIQNTSWFSIETHNDDDYFCAHLRDVGESGGRVQEFYTEQIGFEPAYLEGLEVVCRMWELTTLSHRDFQLCSSSRQSPGCRMLVRLYR